MRKKRTDHPEQMIDGDLLTTRDYAAECKEEFRSCMRDIFIKIGTDVFNGHDTVAERYTEDALTCFNRYFQSMKGGINLTENDPKSALVDVEKRQKALYSYLRDLSDRFEERGVGFEIGEPGFYQERILWETGPEPGCIIKTTNDVLLYAYPLLPFKTIEYMVPRGGPIAAQIIHLHPSCVLFMQHGEDPGEDFSAAFKSILGEPREITEQIPHVHNAILFENFLELNVLEPFSFEELEEMRKRFGVKAVLHGDPHEFTAYLHTGTEGRLPNVLRELLGE